MPSVMAVINLATLHRTAPTRFLHQEHHATKTDLIQGINTPTTKGTDHTPIMVPDIGAISAGHTPFTIPITTEAAFLEGTPHVPLPATTAVHTPLQLMDAPITTCAITPTGIVAPHPTLATYPTYVTHTTTQTGNGLISSTSHHTAQEPQARKAKQCPRPSTPHKPHHSKTVIIQDSPSDFSSDSDSDSDPLNY